MSNEQNLLDDDVDYLDKGSSSNMFDDLQTSGNSEQLARNKDTEHQERIIMAEAKAFAFKIAITGVMITLCICVWRAKNITEAIKAVMPIISGILSFIAGRFTRQ